MIRLVVLTLALVGTTVSAPVHPKLPDSKQMMCLVDNIYHEARGESYTGKLAVAKVTLNRVNHKNYPKTICQVVYQPKQFSWTIKYKKKPINTKEWLACYDAAYKVFVSNKLNTFTATHYHNTTVNPKWKLQRIASIGKHHFYS